ncbi:hypothetical protein BDD12DRAFT_857787 [Trichophaea hybrida]|nr:hypothetical protein BDD12DRAFT_857787 [Trichophaea hybrida]
MDRLTGQKSQILHNLERANKLRTECLVMMNSIRQNNPVVTLFGPEIMEPDPAWKALNMILEENGKAREEGMECLKECERLLETTRGLMKVEMQNGALVRELKKLERPQEIKREDI